MVLSQFQKLLKVFIQPLQWIYLKNFQKRQINMRLNLSMIITKNFHYLKISSWTLLKYVKVTKATQGFKNLKSWYTFFRALNNMVAYTIVHLTFVHLK